jgi:hypothetical protein
VDSIQGPPTPMVVFPLFPVRTHAYKILLLCITVLHKNFLKNKDLASKITLCVSNTLCSTKKSFCGFDVDFCSSSSTTVFQDRRAHTPGVSMLGNLTSRPTGAQNRLDRPKILRKRNGQQKSNNRATEKQHSGNEKATHRQHWATQKKRVGNKKAT